MKNERTLKPCPFCGGNARYLQDMRFEDKPESFPKWYVQCMDCGIRTPVATILPVQERWNKREELIEELKQLRFDIAAYKVDHDQPDEYNEAFDDGVEYALDMVDKYISEAET